MSTFILQPCKLREDRFVPTKAEPMQVGWVDLCNRLAPNKSPQALMTLRRLEHSAYVGLALDLKTKNAQNFFLMNFDRSNRVGWLLKKDPSFSERLIEVYRVDGVTYDSKVEENPQRVVPANKPMPNAVTV